MWQVYQNNTHNLHRSPGRRGPVTGSGASPVVKMRPDAKPLTDTSYVLTAAQFAVDGT